MARTAGINILVYEGITAASATLNFTGDVTDGETVTIGTDIYEFDTAVSPGAVTAGHIRVDVSAGATAPAAVTALVAAINANPGSLVTGFDNTGDNVTVTAKEYGTDGNLIAKAKVVANATWDAGAYLTTGTDILLAHQRSGSIKVNGETIDITTKSSLSWWREFLSSWLDAEVQCGGLLDVNDWSQEQLHTAMVAQRHVFLRWILQASATRYFKGAFWITSHEISGAHDGAGETAATFKLDGALSYVDA